MAMHELEQREAVYDELYHIIDVQFRALLAMRKVLQQLYEAPKEIDVRPYIEELLEEVVKASNSLEPVVNALKEVLGYASRGK